MAYENIRFVKQNMTIADGYFWSIDEAIDALIVKTDDGTQAYTYPLDTTLTNPIKSLEYDGYNLWSLEDAGGNDVTIRRWEIENYVCKLVQTFPLVESGSQKYDADTFTVEHYHMGFDATEAAGQTRLSITPPPGSKLQIGHTIRLGPSTSTGFEGRTEALVVAGIGVDYIDVSATTYPYESGDGASFYNNFWVFNNFDGLDSGNGSLLKFNAYTPYSPPTTTYAGGAYKDITACTFFTIPKEVFNTALNTPYTEDCSSVCYIKATNMLFLNPDDMNNAFGSMTMDNIESNQTTVITVYDLCFEDENIYRLQLKATYYGTTASFAGGTYNYQLATLDKYITSISLAASPAILPADGGTSAAVVTAIVKDQFNLPVEAKLVYFTEDDDDGYIVTSPVSTDGDGVATNNL